LLVVLGLAACGGSAASTDPSSTAPGAQTSDTSVPELDSLTIEFVKVIEASGYDADNACVDEVVSRIPSSDDAERSLRNMTGDTVSNADDDLVLSWIEDDLFECVVDEGAATTSDGDEPSNSNVRAGVEQLIASSSGETEVCPFGEVEQFAAAAGYGGQYISNDIRVRDDRISCGARQEDVAPATNVSIDIRLDVASRESYLADAASFMAVLETFASDSGSIRVVCPREQTQGDKPEHCEAFWFADSAALVIELSVSASAVDPNDVAAALVAILPTLKSTLAAATPSATSDSSANDSAGECPMPEVVSDALGLPLPVVERGVDLYDDPYSVVGCAYLFPIGGGTDVAGISFYSSDDPNRAAIADNFRRGAEGWDAAARPDLGSDVFVSQTAGCTIWSPTVEYSYAQTSDVTGEPSEQAAFECGQAEVLYLALNAELQ